MKLKKRLAYHLILLLPLVAGCSSNSGAYDVNTDPSAAVDNVNSIIYAAVQKAVIPIAIAGIGFSAVTLILGVTNNTGSPEEAVAIAKRRIIAIICAVIAFFLINKFFVGLVASWAEG